MGLRNAASTYQESNSGFLQSSFKKQDLFPLGLNNMATSYQALLHGSTSPIQGVPLTRAQEGLILTITSQDYIVHRLGSIPKDDNTRLLGTTVVLAYQEGDSICDTKAFTKVLSSSKNIETSVNNEEVHAREVFMIRRPRSALIPPEAPNVRSSDESESNISPDA
jgi:hypothetical protein